MTETRQRLISADSHVLIRPDDVRARLPQRLIPAYDDALATQAAANEKLRAGQVLTMDSFDPEGSRSAGYYDAPARLRDMDRDGVETEVLYSELSAFRHFHLVGDEWRVVARAFNDHLADFAAVDPKRRTGRRRRCRAADVDDHRRHFVRGGEPLND